MANADPIPIDKLAAYPQMSSVTLSRDGDYLVGLVSLPDSKKQSLAVWDTSDLTQPPKLTKPDGDVEFLGAQAMKAGKILVFARTKWTGALAGCGEGKRIGSTKTYLNKIFVTDTEFSSFDTPFEGSSSRRDMSSFEEICSQIVGTGRIVSDLPLDPNNVVIANSSGVFDNETKYIKYNLNSGDSELLFTDRSSESVDFIDPKTAEVWTQTESDWSDGRFKSKIHIRDAATGEFSVHEKLTSDSKDRHNISVIGRDDASGQFYIATDQFSDKVRIYLYDPQTQNFSSEPVFSNADFDVISMTQSSRAANFGEPIGYTIGGAAYETIYTDPLFATVKQKFEAQFPGKNVSISDWSHDRSAILITVEGSDMPPAYFITVGGNQFSFLGSQYPDLTKMDLSSSKLVYYSARDGKSIPAILTMPTGWTEGDAPPPAIIHPHGGPWSRDVASWDPSGWVPFLTSRGFAVLQPQYRGSTGWGRDLWLAGDAQWGLQMQDDKDDGAQWMIENGYADPEKIAIFGYSYGGFAAFAAAVRSDSPYQCAIAGAGVSDLTKLGRLWSDNRLQRAYQGKTVRGMDPLTETDNVQLPMLIFHGDRDVRVPLFHGKDFYNKIKDDVDAKLVVIDDQPHSLPWTPEMKEKILDALEDYLKKECFR